MPNAHHWSRQSSQDVYIQKWLTGLHERTSDPGLSGPAGFQSVNRARWRRCANEKPYTEELPSKKRRPLETGEGYLSGADKKKLTRASRIGLQPPRALKGRRDAASAPLPPQQIQKRSGGSDSSLLEIGSKSCELPGGTPQGERVDPAGTVTLGGVLKRDISNDGQRFPREKYLQPRLQQAMFEKRARRRTRHDLYDPKPPKQRVKKGPSGKATQGLTGRTREKSGDALHWSFTSENITRGRLTLNPSSRVGLFKKGYASSPAEKRGLPDLAFSEMQFLHNWKRRANDRPRERSDGGKHCKRDKDMEFHENISSYFHSAQGALTAGNAIRGSCTYEAEDRILTLDPNDRDMCRSYDRSSDCYRAHGRAGCASLPTELGAHLAVASTPLENRSEGAIRPNTDTRNETASKLSWSISARSPAVLDASPKGLSSRSRESSNGSPSEATKRADQPDTRQFPGYLAYPGRSIHGNGGQKQECVSCKRTELTRVRGLRGFIHDEEVAESLSGKGLWKEGEQPMSGDGAMLGPTTSAGPRVGGNEGANKEQRLLGCSNLGTTGITKHQLTPRRYIYLHDRGTSPGVFSYGNIADSTVTTSTAGAAHFADCAESRAKAVGRCSLPIESGFDAGTYEMAACVQSDGEKLGPTKVVLSNRATNASLAGNVDGMSLGELTDYNARKQLRIFERGLVVNGHTAGQLWLPSSYSTHIISSDQTIAPNLWNDGKNVLRNFFDMSTEKEILRGDSPSDEKPFLTGIRGPSVVGTDLEESQEIEPFKHNAALNPGDLETGDSARRGYLRYMSNTWTESGPCLFLDDIQESGSSPVGDDCLEDIASNLDQSEISAPTYRDDANTSPQLFPAERYCMEDKFLNTHDSNRSHDQHFLSQEAFHTEDRGQIRFPNTDCVSMSDFWRPHRLY